MAAPEVICFRTGAQLGCVYSDRFHFTDLSPSFVSHLPISPCKRLCHRADHLRRHPREGGGR
jgi:hypothetical protein